MADPCPICGKNRVVVGRMHHCVPVNKELQDCAGALDVLIPHPDGTGLYEPGDPPGVNRAATLAAALCTEVRALHIADVSFPKYRWDLATKSDFRKALIEMLHAAWGYTPGATRGPLKPGQRLPNGTSVFAAVLASKRRSQHEQI
jgi:hypothetical protein